MRPTTRFLKLIGAWILLGIGASIWPDLKTGWFGAGFVLLLVSLADIASLPRKNQIKAARAAPGRFALGVRGAVTLSLQHDLKRPLPVRMHDGLPPWSEADGLPWSGVLPPGEVARLTYDLHFTRRGAQTFSAAHVLARSSLGLWENLYRVAGGTDTRCYPDYEPVVRFALLATANREEQMGIVKRRRAGATLDFHQLREYQDGDVLSRIDWKATSRRQTLVSRDYEEQRNQTIILVPDCGRRMRAMDGELSQFDHCLNAMLLISFIALRQGDEAGIIGFGGVQRWLKPVKGAASMPKLLNHIYDYETTGEPSDFIEAAERVLARQKRRALVIFLTNLRTEDSTHLLSAVRLLQRRHMTIVATLREAEMEQRAATPVRSLHDALGFGALCSYFQERERLLQNLRASRIMTVDETAQHLPVALANRYLDIKAAGMI
ncbi:MAG: DUF58 domain-containing protein [Verrucomicrobiaceae bacterium]|nr:DUF58 domain-containing protein [Verrucomicrobiaceae bacterium]